MPATDKQRLSKFRVTYLFAIITAVIGIGSFGCYIYRDYHDAHRNLPQPQVERLIKDLRRYAAQTRHFPVTFTEINGRLWHTTPTPNYGADGRRAWTKNYHYVYTKVSDETCAFWALPVGPQRHYAPSFFIVVSPSWLRVWKGRSLTDEQVTKIPEIPSPEVLNHLGLSEVAQVSVR